jgi:UDP-N-acetylglucosamine--N-acetylmuramyl-(pentapeptide) pyrophosphoryl-undecaprenol N-acetylglucosamine transferase
MSHLVIMAAGTGGHIMPGLAVAREMLSRGWSVSWLGTSHGMENKLVPAANLAGVALDTIHFSGLRGKGWLHTALGGFHLLKAFWDSLRVLRARGADVVLGMGGYVCFPGGMMTALLGKRLMLVNADAALLLSNRALLPVADRVAFGFEGADAQRTAGAVVTGNPVRAAIEDLPEPALRFAPRHGPLRLLVVGGSLGAQALNQLLPQALALLPLAQRPQVLHQAGVAHVEALRAAYAAAGVSARVEAFIDDMPQQLADCDLMVCRAGAITVSEICAAGVAAVLVPLIVSTTSHQRDNAQWLAQHQAGVHLPQLEATPTQLAALLQSHDRASLLALATQARSLARKNAAARVADELERLVRKPT